MHTIKLQLKLLSPLLHTESTNSNIANIYREKCLIDTEIHEVPSYHGNALRGTLRNLWFDHMLQVIEFPRNHMMLDIFHVLFSWWALNGSTNGFDIEHKKEVRQMIPLLSVLWSAMGNEMLQWKLKVSTMRPQCKELGTGTQSYWDLVQIIRYTRQDDSKMDVGGAWLGPVERTKQQMFYDTECLIAGAVLEWDIYLDTDNPIEIGAFYDALHCLHDNPHIGWGSRVGHGKIEIQNDIDRNIRKPYLDYLSDNKESICDWIKTNG